MVFLIAFFFFLFEACKKITVTYFSLTIFSSRKFKTVISDAAQLCAFNATQHAGGFKAIKKHEKR